MCTYRIVGIAQEIATTKCMDPLCSRRNTTFRLTRGTLGAQRKNEGRVVRWKEKNREKVKERMRMRMADCRERKREREKERQKGKVGEKWMYGWERERERHTYIGRDGKRKGKRGPVSVSLQFRAVVRRCTQPFAYESGSEERTEGPEACMWRPWYEDKQSLAIMQIPLRWRDVLEKKKRGWKRGRRASRRSARARIIRLMRPKNALQLRKILRISDTFTITVERIRNPDASIHYITHGYHTWISQTELNLLTANHIICVIKI